VKKLLLVALTAMTLAGCGTSRPNATVAPAANHTNALAAKSAERFPPMIQYVTANGMMGYSFVAPPNYPMQFMCWATGDGFLNYTWQAWGPIFGMNQYANWTTPYQPGNYNVQVWVRSQTGEATWANIYVQVRPQAKLAVQEMSDADKETAKKPVATPAGASKVAPAAHAI
jgi:hypothetical protein